MLNILGKTKILFILLFVLVPSTVLAFSYNTVTQQKYDQSLSDQANTIYATPSTFYITQVTTLSPVLEKSPELWSKNIYYYAITRLHFSDMPYNFLLDENGQIYEGRQGGIGANAELKNIDKAVVIGYMSNNPILTTTASNALLTMVTDISKSWGISSYKTVTLQINQTEGNLSTVTPLESDGDLSKSVKESLSSWKGSAREELPYKPEIVEVIYSKTVDIGSELEVKVNVKNMNDFTWLTDKNPIYVSTKDGKDSIFAINAVWDSFSKPTHLENKAVKPGEIIELNFKLQPRVQPGEASQDFVLMKFDKQPFAGSDFSVKFTIEKGKYTLVKVHSAEYGFANIRECQWFSCKIIDSADEGTVFILNKEENGWMQIQYDKDTVGWAFSRYMKRI